MIFSFIIGFIVSLTLWKLYPVIAEEIWTVLQVIYEKILEIFNKNSFGGVTRSPQWPEVQKAHLKEEPLCAVCQTKGELLNTLNVHHIHPFHIHPELELQDSNLITLCRKDHLLFGHLNNWASWNEGVREDAGIWKTRIAQRP